MKIGSFSKSMVMATVVAPLCHGIPIPMSSHYHNVNYDFLRQLRRDCAPV